MKILFIICLVLYCINLSAQQIQFSGYVKDKTFNPIPSATIQLKPANNPSQKQQFSFSDNDGYFSFNINPAIDAPWFVIASYLGYKRDTLLIESNQIRSGKIEISFTLELDNQILDEIYIKARKGVQTDNDTTSYRVTNFTTPQDRNLEDVLKKMPGMDVKQDGTIFFKGKKISKVLLDGDDLTGDGYKVLTKNIKPEFVKDVQAIDNYVDDILLKGIINSDDIVLNLKMNNPKALFGSIDAGGGNNQRFRAVGNAVSYLNKTKTYITTGANNIGQPQTNLLSLFDEDQRIPSSDKVIHHQVTATNPFDPNKFIINNSSLLSANAVKMVSDNFKMKANFHLINDHLSNESTVNNNYFLPNEFSTRDQSDNNSRNQTIYGNGIGDYLLSSNSRLWTKFEYTYNPYRFASETFSSLNEQAIDRINQKQRDFSRNLFTELKYTLKLNEGLAFILGGQLLKERMEQDYRPGSLLFKSSTLFNNSSEIRQEANQRNDQFQMSSNILYRKNLHYLNLSLGYNYQQTKLNTDLFYQDTTSWTSLGDSFRNNSPVRDKRFYANTKYTFDNNRFKLQAQLLTTRVNTFVFEKDSTFIVFQPQLGLKWRVKDIQTLSMSYKYRNIELNPFEYYKNLILTDFRATSRGLTDFYNFGTHQVLISYNYNDFIDKYLSVNLSSNTNISRQGFIFNSFFDDPFIISQKIAYRGLRSISGSLLIQKFIPFFSTNLSINYTFSARDYFSVLASQIRKFRGNTHQVIAKGDTGFDFPVNLNAEFQLLNDATFSQKSFVASNSSYKYSMQARWQIKPTILTLTSLDWYQINNQNYRLLNTEIQINPKKGAFKYSLEGKNLMNLKSLDNFFISDVSSTNLSSSILGRYILFNIYFSIK
jgi:hypothetical protein